MKNFEKGAIALSAVMCALALSGCATRNPFSGFAGAVAAINPAYAGAAAQVEKALSASKVSVAVDEAAVMRAAGYAPVETYYFRGTECAASDFRLDIAWVKTKTGAEVFSAAAPVSSSAAPSAAPGAVDLDSLAESFAALAAAVEAKAATEAKAKAK